MVNFGWQARRLFDNAVLGTFHCVRSRTPVTGATARLALGLATALVLVSAGCSGSGGASRPAAAPSIAPTWNTVGTSNSMLAGQGPPFPADLNGWQRQREWTEITRAFTGQWTSVCGSDACPNPYPATMNGCADQRFLIRWRSLGDPVLFAYGDVSGTTNPIVEQQMSAPAQQGWAELTGCLWPLWQYQSGLPSTLGDIAVSVQHWTAAP